MHLSNPVGLPTHVVQDFYLGWSASTTRMDSVSGRPRGNEVGVVAAASKGEAQCPERSSRQTVEEVVEQPGAP